MRRLVAVGFMVLGGAISMPVVAQRPASAPALEIRTLSARPDLVSGDDVLLEIAGPASLAAKNVTVRLNGKEVTAAFHPSAQSKALIGLVTGLQIGSNALQASMRGNRASAQLTIVNHPIAGPVIYSPHQTPFVCETQAHGLGAPLDADCSANTKVEYFYRSSASPTGAGQNNQGDLAAADNANGFGGGAAANPFKRLDPNAPRPADIAMTTTS